MDRQKLSIAGKILGRAFGNKYFLTALAFTIWTGYFDQNDWFTLQQHKRELDKVKSNIAYLQTEIDRMKTEKTGLQFDVKVLERYARETYHMRQDGEDVYVIEKK